MKKNKYLLYSTLAALGLFSVLGTGIASAHGFGFWGGRSNLTPDEIATQQQSMFEHQAQILGINVDDVKSYWAEGKSMQEIIQEKGLDGNQIQARIKEHKTQQMKLQLQTLVERGVISQAQADRRLEIMDSRFDNKMGRMGRFDKRSFF